MDVESEVLSRPRRKLRTSCRDKSSDVCVCVCLPVFCCCDGEQNNDYEMNIKLRKGKKQNLTEVSVFPPCEENSQKKVFFGADILKKST